MALQKGSAIRAFTADQVCRLAGISRAQLAYWDRTGFFSPRSTHGRPGAVYGRIYGFRDVAGLRTIGRLRNEEGVSLQELRKVGEYLQQNFETPWSSLRLFVTPDKKVCFQEPGRDLAWEAREHGQGDYVIVNLEDVAEEVGEAASRLQERAPEQHGRISRNRSVVHNDPVVAGTRVPTRAIWEFHRAGDSDEEILREYPRLTVKDVRAAIRYGRQQKKRAG